MAVKKRDFHKIAQLIQDFLGKLSCEESTAELRDSLNLALLNLQKYYKTLRVRSRSTSNGLYPNSTAKSIGGSLVLCNSNGVVSPVSTACASRDLFEWKWYNLESPRLCASLGTDEFSSLSPVLQQSKDGDKDVLMELLEKDAGVVNQVDGLGRNAVMYAVHGNTAAHTECLELLLTTDCDIDHQANDDTTSLHLAAHDNNSAAMLMLLKSKASVNMADKEGRTPLHWAAANTSTENLKMLLQYGGNMSATDNEGLTPAMWACHFDQLGNLRILKSALARMDPRDDAVLEDTDCCGRTVIHWAVNRTGSLECLAELISQETVLMCTNEGKNLIHIAAEEGCIPACKLALKVRGTTGLQDTDHKNRTPLHVATLCAHGEMIDFLLEMGADLSAVDADGLTPLDYVKSHQLYYCARVIAAHPQYHQLQPEPLINTHSMLFVKSPRGRTSSMNKDERAPVPDDPVAVPSAPSFDLIGKQSDPPPESPKILPTDNIDVTDFDGFEIEEDEDLDLDRETHQVSRRHSVPAMLAPPKMPPRRKNSEPPPVKMPQISNEEEEDHSHKEAVEEQSEHKEKPVPAPRRQSTLTRQGGMRHDSEEQTKQESFDGPTFDMRTEGGETLVLFGNFEDEEPGCHENMIDGGGDLEIDCVDNEMELSSARLNHGHGSPSSVHSEPDNADACSVSVGVSVSSIGSDDDDDDDETQQETAEDIMNQGKLQDESAQQFSIQENERHRIQEMKALRRQQEESARNKGDERVRRQHEAATRGWAQAGHAPPAMGVTERHPQQMTYYEKHPNAKLPTTLDFNVQEDQPNTKKKKDKKKKKQKGAVVNAVPVPVPMPRGLVAPLESPQMGFGPKLGDHFVSKPGPWEHSSLEFRKGAVGTHPPQPPRGTPSDPHEQRHSLGPPEYVRSSSGFIESYDQSDFDSDIAYGRPRTPEPPPHTPRDLIGRVLQPAPPGMGRGGNSHTGYRGPMEGKPFERDVVYGSPGPMHGPVAHANGQALLRNTDMGRGAMMKLDPRAQGMNRPKGPQGFALHGGVQSPHPPLHR